MTIPYRRILVLGLLAMLVAACGSSPELPQRLATATELPPPPATATEAAEEAIPRYEPLEECFEAFPEGLDYDWLEKHTQDA